MLCRLSTCLLFGFAVSAIGEPIVPHPPLRPLEWKSNRPLESGPVFYADAKRGDDSHSGTASEPWRTVSRAVTRLKPGDTLVLRGGIYSETVSVALAGSEKHPITIRSAPGEMAILDGGWREFFESPETCWEPVGGARDEFRSVRPYPNLRNVCGSFGDSMIGLQTYYHAIDLRSENEIVTWQDWERRMETDMEPLWCGPGLWYDRESGRIHLRLAHTRLPEPIANYRGETDPRRVPLILAPFRSVPLTVDGGMHLRFQDLVIRGGGYATIELHQARNIEFDNVTVWCGTYGIRASGTQGLRIVGSGLYGNVAPWTFRGDGSKRDYPGRPHRNISRLNTHALIEIESGRESSVYAFPQNDDWELAWNDFTDAHDGIYLGGINASFHHNRIENMQDDGVYLSPMYRRHRLEDKDPELHLFENEFRQVLTALAFGGPWPETRDQVFIYRNLFDLRHPVSTGRPSTRKAEASFSHGKLMGDHGSPPWPAMKLYHNTVVTLDRQRHASMGTLAGTKSGNERRSFNNLFFHLGPLPGFTAPKLASENAVGDGNLYFSATGELPDAEKWFGKFRAGESFRESQTLYPPGTTANSVVADPGLDKVTPDPEDTLQIMPAAGSPAIDAGIAIPEDWPDSLRQEDAGRADIGALPAGVGSLRAGRAFRP